MNGEILGFRRGGASGPSGGASGGSSGGGSNLPQRAAPNAGALRPGVRSSGLSTRGAPASGRVAEALTALGRLYLTQGFPEQALALLLSAQRRAPQDGELLRLLACAHLMTDSPDKALAVLDRLGPLLEQPEDLRAALHLRARALLALGRSREAQALFEERRRI